MSYFGGCDVSLSGTGIVIMDTDGEVVYAKTLSNTLRGEERLAFIRDGIKEAFDAFPSTVVCVEDYAMGIASKGGGQAFSIGEGGGVAKLALHDLGCEIVKVSPTSLKKFITCGGKAEKDMMLLMVFKNFGYEARDNNEADAFGLAELARVLYLEKTDGLQPAQIEAMQAILDPTAKTTTKKKAKKEPKKKRRVL